VIVCFATKGSGSNEEGRIAGLLAGFEHEVFPFDRARKGANVRALVRMVGERRPCLLVMEGTGLAGALALWLCQRRYGTPYVVSTGDAVGPFLSMLHPRVGPVGGWYERLLYRRAAGVIGWTPYLVGRAFTLGARRAMTAANWTLAPEVMRPRAEMRAALGIPPDALVFGLVGALVVEPRHGYCYGADLVSAIRRVRRRDVRVLVAGGGDGLERLRELAGGDDRVVLAGPVPQEEVTSYLAAMDVGSLPQTVDQVGALRYTTKLSEYLTAGLPVVTGQIPLAYDLDDGWLWRLPGDAPWTETYVAALADLMEDVPFAEVAERRSAVPRELRLFDAADQRKRVRGFIEDILAGAA
jgi:hypothetical protein